MKESKTFSRHSLLQFAIGIFCIIVSMTLPSFLELDNLGLLDVVWMSQLTQLANPLLFSAPLVIFLNTIQLLPLIIGIFII